MRLKINGEKEETEAASLSELLKLKKIEPQMVTVELNGQMIDRKKLADCPLHEGDEVELLYFMGGGSHHHA